MGIVSTVECDCSNEGYAIYHTEYLGSLLVQRYSTEYSIVGFPLADLGGIIYLLP